MNTSSFTTRALLWAEAAAAALMLAAVALIPPAPRLAVVERDWTATVTDPSPTIADLESVFAAIDYDFRAVRDGQSTVPRVRVDSMPEDLGQVAEVARRKTVFFATVLPLVLAVNEQINDERAQVQELAVAVRTGQPLSNDQTDALFRLAKAYDLVDAGTTELNDLDLGATIDSLLMRVAPVPVSLALAQAAEESAWGMSRFALEGNALYGQWVWNDAAGLIPQARGEGQSHSVRAFRSILESTLAYARNLNTHWAYKDFRRMRAQMLAQNKSLDGHALAATLIRYSERGPAYVTSLRTIIRGNDLAALDTANFAGPDTSVRLKSVRASAGTQAGA